MREKRVDLKIPAYVRETLTALETAGHQAYCVGGCVRDSLLGRMPRIGTSPPPRCRRRP